MPYTKLPAMPSAVVSVFHSPCAEDAQSAIPMTAKATRPTCRYPSLTRDNDLPHTHDTRRLQARKVDARSDRASLCIPTIPGNEPPPGADQLVHHRRHSSALHVVNGETHLSGFGYGTAELDC